MEMTLDYLATFINDNTVVDIYAECTGTPIATYDGKNSIPYRYMDELVTDIFTDKEKGSLCIEIAIEPDTDYEEE